MTKTHIIKNGEVVNTIQATAEEAQRAYPDADVVESEQGGKGWRWDGETLSAPPRFADDASAAEARTELAKQLRSIARGKRDGGINFNGVRVGTDHEARSLILGGRVNQKERRKIVTEAGQRAELTGAEFVALADAVDNHIQAVIDNEYRLLGELDAAVSVSELLAVDLDAGWPS